MKRRNLSGLKNVTAAMIVSFGTLLASNYVIDPAYAQPVPRIKPAAPVPAYVSLEDYKILNGFFEALDKRQWGNANAYRQRLNDPVARNLSNWAFYRQNPSDSTYQEIGVFLDQFPDWPQSRTLQRSAEKQIDNQSNPDDILAFFQQRDPISGNGKIQLARAELSRNKIEAAKIHIASAWIVHDWPRSEETALLNKYGRYLTADNHVAKADRQLFEIKATNTKRLLNLLPAKERRKAEVRIAFLTRSSNATILHAKLPKEDRLDSGVLHAATRYYRRSDNEPTAIGYAMSAPKTTADIRNPERWWTERNLLMRWALKNGHFQEAYEMTAFTGLTEGTKFSEAEFNAGWIALRFLNQPARARAHFLYMEQGVQAPISKGRAHYWLGRTHQAQGNDDYARRYYAVAASYPYTYYGQLAMEEIAPDYPPATFPSKQKATTDELVIFNSRPLVYVMNILRELDRDKEFITFARQLDDQIEAPGELIAFEDMMREEDKLFLSIRAAKVAVRSGAGVPHVSYPVIDVPERAADFVETPMILGLSRQESEFNPRAYSSARARGLMQMLPSTARLTARKEKIPYRLAGLMDDPQYNMTLGAAHLSHLLERFNGSYIMTFAAYNAGPHRVDRWVKEYGDPRTSNIDPIDWVELIPFGETRNYVQRVSENIQIYRAQLNGLPLGGQLSSDIVRGGGTTTAIGITPSNATLERLARGKSTVAMKLPDAKPQAVALNVKETPPPSVDRQLQLAKSRRRAPASIAPVEPKPIEAPVATTIPEVAENAPQEVAPQEIPQTLPLATVVPSPTAPIVAIEEEIDLNRAVLQELSNKETSEFSAEGLDAILNNDTPVLNQPTDIQKKTSPSTAPIEPEAPPPLGTTDTSLTEVPKDCENNTDIAPDTADLNKKMLERFIGSTTDNC